METIDRRRMLAGAAALAAVVAAGGRAAAGKPSIYQDRAGVAIDGTDPVAYFTEGRPVTGSPAHAADWMGATWRFASARNRALFLADPERYAPRFGGYCAFAVANGYTASTVPEAWSIVDGRLYLNYSRSIHRRWRRDVAGHIAAGQRNWPGVLR